MSEIDIRLLVSFKGHRKRKRLKRLIGPEATDYLIDLWLSVRQDRPEGNLDGWDEIDIADAAGWPEGRDPKELVDALVESKWLDCDDGVYSLHDWEEHQGWACGETKRKEAAKKAALAKWKKRTNNNQNPSEDMRNGCGRNADAGKTQCDRNAGADADTGKAQYDRNAGADANGKGPQCGRYAPSPSPSPSPTPNVKQDISKEISTDQPAKRAPSASNHSEDMRNGCDRNADAGKTQCDRNATADADAGRAQCDRNAGADADGKGPQCGRYAPSPSPSPSPTPNVKQDISKEISTDQPAKRAPSASNHFSAKVGEFADKIKRYCQDIDKRCRFNVNGKRFNAWEWVTKQTKIRGHPMAITQSLEWLLVNWDEVDNPWGFADATFKTKNPKCNERQELKEAQAMSIGKNEAANEFRKIWSKVLNSAGPS